MKAWMGSCATRRGHPASDRCRASGQAGRQSDARRTARRDDALDGPGPGRGHRREPALRATNLGGARPYSPSRTDVQALYGSTFVEKFTDVVGLYVDPPAHAVVLSVDEKSQIQALDRTQPGLPMKKGRAGTMTHDYNRHGTTTLFAALNVLDGTVIGQLHATTPARGVHSLPQRGRAGVPAGKLIHAIADNYATHKHPKVRAWLARHPRWTFHFTPTSCSWLNAVENFFATLTRRRLKRGVFYSLVDLQAAINRYLAEHNHKPKPFVWTADPDRIIAKVHRGYQTLASDH